MSSEPTSSKGDELQFDRVGPGAGTGGTATGVVCSGCQTTLNAEYYQVNGKPFCANCRRTIEEQVATPRTMGALVKAGLFGFGAAIAGGVGYFVFVAATGYELSLITIFVGYMVGFAVRKGAKGRGGRRYQLIAAALTYWAVGLSYGLLGLKGSLDEKGGKTPVTADTSQAAAVARGDSALVVRPQSAVVDSSSTRGAAEHVSTGAMLAAVGMLTILPFALPVMVIAGSGGSGLLSVVILLIGIAQAWAMTRAPKLIVSGPHRVGMGPSTA
jgi:hypothetical protein